MPDTTLQAAIRAAFDTKLGKTEASTTYLGINAKAVSAGTADSATTASRLATAQAITLTGAVTGTANFDGSAGVTITTSSGAGLSSVPPGTIISYAGKTIPDGWLLCNGAAVSRTDYANLFAAIGTTYGSGNGSTTFNLPELNNRFLECTTSTSNVGTKLSAGLPEIQGSLTSPKEFDGAGTNFESGSGAFSMSTKGHSVDSESTFQTGGYRYAYLYASRSSSTYGNSSSIQPPSLYTLVLIKS